MLQAASFGNSLGKGQPEKNHRANQAIFDLVSMTFTYSCQHKMSTHTYAVKKALKMTRDLYIAFNFLIRRICMNLRLLWVLCEDSLKKLMHDLHLFCDL